MTLNIKPPEAAAKRPKYLIAVPFFIGLSITLLSPLDILKYEIPKTITEIASYIFPSVRRMDGNYEFGEVAKLYFSAMWLMSPSIFIYLLKEMQSQAYKFIPKCQERRLTSLLFCCGFLPLATIGLVLYSTQTNDMYDFRVFLTFHSKWGMPVFGFFLPAGACAMLAITVCYIKNIRHIFS